MIIVKSYAMSTVSPARVVGANRTKSLCMLQETPTGFTRSVEKAAAQSVCQ